MVVAAVHNLVGSTVGAESYLAADHDALVVLAAAATVSLEDGALREAAVNFVANAVVNLDGDIDIGVDVIVVVNDADMAAVHEVVAPESGDWAGDVLVVCVWCVESGPCTSHGELMLQKWTQRRERTSGSDQRRLEMGLHVEVPGY